MIELLTYTTATLVGTCTILRHVLVDVFCYDCENEDEAYLVIYIAVSLVLRILWCL